MEKIIIAGDQKETAIPNLNIAVMHVWHVYTER